MPLYAHVTGWGKYVPHTVLTNDDLATFLDTSDEWIRQHTGIRERRIAIGDETVAAMSAAAARAALDVAGLTPQDLDLIILSTSSPDRQLPGAAPLLQAELGAAQAAAFDMRSGCSGFVYALSIARQFVVCGTYRRVLVVGAEVVSRYLDWSDRRTCVLFGDGAGAAIVEGSAAPGGVLFTAMGTQGQDYEALTVRAGGSAYPVCPRTVSLGYHHIEMDGQRTASFALRTLLRRAGQAVEGAGLTWDDIDLFIPHQANLRLIELTAAKLHLPMARMFVNVDRYANMSTASVPVALAEAAESGRIQPGDRVLLLAFGAGLSWGTAVIEWGAGGGTHAAANPLHRAGQRLRTGWVEAQLALSAARGRRRH